jgi:hypothetical protein
MEKAMFLETRKVIAELSRCRLVVPYQSVDEVRRL